MIRMKKIICIIVLFFVILPLNFYIPIKNVNALNETTTATIYIYKDTYIYEAYPDKNYDSASFIAVGRSAVTLKRVRALLYFSVPSYLSSYEIVSAKLVLTISSTHNFELNSLPFWIFRVTHYWYESTTTWNKRSSTTPWDTPGGDFSTDGPDEYGSYAKFTVYKNDPVGKKIEIDITPLVEAWVYQGKTNYGLIIRHSYHKGTVHFYDRETSDVSKKPKVIITYKKPKIKLTSITYTRTINQGGNTYFTLTADYQVVDKDTLGVYPQGSIPTGFTVTYTTLSKTSEKWVFKLNIYSDPNVAVGTYYFKVYVKGKSSTTGSTVQSNTITLKVVVQKAGTFDIVLNPSSLTLAAGGNKKNIVLSIVGKEGFTGTVTITVAKPAGFTVQIADNTVNAGSSTNVKISASTSVHPGTYNIVFKGTYGAIEVQKTLTVTVTSSFDLVFNPSSITVSKGGSKEIELNVVGKGGFTGSIKLSVVNKPTGFTIQIFKTNVNAGSKTNIRVSVADNVEPGTYNVIFKGKSGAVEVQKTLKVTVVKVPFNYKLKISPNSLTLKKGESGTVSVNIQLLTGNAENIQLSVEGLPSDVSYSFDKNPASPGDTVTLTINAGSTTGKYTVVIKGVSADSNIEKSAVISIEITETAMEYSVTVTPTTLEINQGESGSVQVQVQYLGGEKKQVTLIVSGVPSGASASFNPSTLTPPGASTLTINAGSAKGTFTLLIQAKVDDTTKTATLTLIIKEKKCIVATATYGSELSPEVMFLRKFRDNIVLSTYSGQRFYTAFNAFYYSWSPYFAQFMHQNPWTKTPMKIILYPLILGLHVASTLSMPLIDINPEMGVYFAGALSSIFIGIFYFTPMAYIVWRLLRKKITKIRLNDMVKYIMLSLLAFVMLSMLAMFMRIDILLTFATSGYVLSIIALTSSVLVKSINYILKRNSF